MTGGKSAGKAHQTKLDKFASVREAPMPSGGLNAQVPVGSTSPEKESLSLHDLMMAIKRLLTSLEARIDSATTEVRLVRVDLRNTGARIKGTEKSTASLKVNTVTLKAEVNVLRVTTRTLEARLEDHKGQTQCNKM
ncbi:hypothetical protein NDU88_005516 [Pleurodeles waltl]|uniref:Uncharacterized protein n=1 Tax=Pleurodeles waltl TaxID=8319 RepID=A0AAV7UJT4_PLEWA|nr:hypothetical protein NDU88_005516 [Pleurodeles waltl]